MGQESTRVVYAALVGNLLVAATKFIAAGVSGSSAMLTEAIHSSADSADQLLLLVGDRRSRAKPDDSHSFGYGMEIYFWTFVVAVIVLLAGGVTSIWQGIGQIAAPAPIRSAWINFAVLILSLIFELSSLSVGYRAYRRTVFGKTYQGHRIGLWRFIFLSKDPNLYESLLEDSADVMGIVLATLGVAGSVFLHLPWADGAASIAIGVLLVADSLVIATATRSLIAGESVVPALMDDLLAAVASKSDLVNVSEIKTLHLGPNCILVALTVNLDQSKSVADSRKELSGFIQAIRSVDARIEHVHLLFGELIH